MMKVHDLFDLSNNVAVVTGGSGYLGTSISEALAEAGAEVYVTGRNEKKCRAVAKKIQKKVKPKVNGLTMDIQSNDSIKKCFNKIIEQSGKIDILVNNAVIVSKGKLEDISENNWKLGMNGTINNVFKCTQNIIPIMVKKKSGSIINISSMYGDVSPDPSIYGNTDFDSPPNYAAGKAAITHFTRFAACHLAKKGIRVNAVSPGPFPHPETQKNKRFISNLEKKTPLGRIGKPFELKGVIVFLASNASSYVTGENIHVDGGWTAW